MAKQLIGGGILGGLAAAVGLVFGIPGMTAAVVIVVLVGLSARRPALVAGGLIGLGATWLVLFARVAVLCGQPQQQCGSSPPEITPWLAISGAVIFVGVLIAALASRKKRREQRSS